MYPEEVYDCHLPLPYELLRPIAFQVAYELIKEKLEFPHDLTNELYKQYPTFETKFHHWVLCYCLNAFNGEHELNDCVGMDHTHALPYRDKWGYRIWNHEDHYCWGDGHFAF
jgi:hypothetical protein